jgi:hypothetical protein
MMLTTFTSKHKLMGCENEKRTHTPLHCQNSEPIRVAEHEPLRSPLSSGGILLRRRQRPGGGKRKTHKNNCEPCPLKRCPVTICAAVLCDIHRQPVLLGISDRMLTWSEEIEYETEKRTKIFPFPERDVPPDQAKIVALGAGNYDSHAAIAERTHQAARAKGITDVGKIARLYAANYARLKRERAERLYLAPIGLDMRSFIAKQRVMLPSEVSRLSECLQDVKLKVETIIAGQDSSGLHIYTVNDNLEAVRHDHDGYCAVGSGSPQFEMQFMYSGYDGTLPFPNALFLTYIAKKHAEVSPGVGRMTDVLAIRSDGGMTKYSQDFKMLWNSTV